MSLASPNNVEFYSGTTIDKVVDDDGSMSSDVSGGNPVIPTASTISEAHTIGRPVIVNAMFSINNADFYPAGVSIEGALDGGTALRQYSRCYGYASGSTVYFYLENGFTTSKTFYIRYSLESLT
jgi:hypothetical protein